MTRLGVMRQNMPVTPGMLDRARLYFCSPSDEEKFIKSVLARDEKAAPFSSLAGRYTRTLSSEEYLSQVREIQEQLRDWLIAESGVAYDFDPSLPRHLFWSDAQGEEHQGRVSKFLKRYKAPPEIRNLLTRFPPKIGNQVEIEISVDPVDILTKSTGRSWAATSCERLGGAFSAGPFSDIENNNAIAFLYRPGEGKPFGRYMLRWCLTDDGKLDIGVEPTMYPPSPLNRTIRRELVALLRERGYVNYDECHTPYVYRGYSDRMRKGHTKITYREKVQAMSALMRELEEEFARAENRWTGLDWDGERNAQEASWDTPAEYIMENLEELGEAADIFSKLRYRLRENNAEFIIGALWEGRTIREQLDSNEIALLYEWSQLPSDEWHVEAMVEDLIKDQRADVELENILEDEYGEELAQQLLDEVIDFLDKMEEGPLIEVPLDSWKMVWYDDTTGNDATEIAQNLGITLEEGETVLNDILEVASDAREAQAAASAALGNARQGDWDRAIENAARASRLELEYGDDPTWGPFRLMIEEAAASAE